MLKELFEEFLIINYQVEESRKNMRYIFKWFEDFIREKKKDFRNLTKADILEFRAWLEKQKNRRNKKFEPKAMRMILDLVKAFYEFLETYGVRNPFRELPPRVMKRIFPRVKKDKVPREFRDDELERIYKELKNRDKNVFVACLIAMLTGARLREVLSLRSEDFFERDGNLYVVIKEGKGFKERISVVGLPYKDFVTGEEVSKVIKRINRWGQMVIRSFVSKKNGYIFGDEDERRRLRMRIQQNLYRISKETGIKVKFHDFRSNWGAKALLCRVPLEYVSKQLGHSLTSTTERYYARVKEEQVLRELGKLS